MDINYAATLSTLVRPKYHLHADLQPQALPAPLVDRYLSRHLVMELGTLPLMIE